MVQWALPMSADLVLVLLLLAAAIVMFAFNRPRMDAVALIMMTALPLTGVITLDDALAGLSDPNIVLIAVLFVIGEGLVRTGVTQRLGDFLIRHAGGKETKLLFYLMFVAAGLGAFMSSTGVVALFIPVVLGIARKADIAPSRLMMPLSMAALISGMMTLVATAPNLVVHGELVRAGHAGFSFFAFAPFGLTVLLFGVGYMAFARRWLGAGQVSHGDAVDGPYLTQWVEEYGLSGRGHCLQVTANSPLAGRRLDELRLRSRDGVNILGIERRGRLVAQILQPTATTMLRPGDVLFLDVDDPARDMAAFSRRLRLRPLRLGGPYFVDHAQEIGMMELLIPATSSLIGKTVVQSRFRTKHDLSVIGLKHGKKALRGPVRQEKLRLGDTLLVVGPWRALRRLRNEYRDLVALSLPVEMEDAPAEPSRAPYAVAGLALTVVLMTTGVVSNLQAALIGALLLGLTRCVDMPGAYRSIHWQTLIVIVGMLPFSVALQNTGGIDLISGFILDLLGTSSPRLLLMALFLLTAGFSMFMSNTATAVLMAPIAIAVAQSSGFSPYPFALAVALAASTAFMTPVSSPVNMLVVLPGGYQFKDFLRVGTPFSALVLCICMVMIPLIFPF